MKTQVLKSFAVVKWPPPPPPPPPKVPFAPLTDEDFKLLNIKRISLIDIREKHLIATFKASSNQDHVADCQQFSCIIRLASYHPPAQGTQCFGDAVLHNCLRPWKTPRIQNDVRRMGAHQRVADEVGTRSSRASGRRLKKEASKRFEKTASLIKITMFLRDGIGRYFVVATWW